MGRYIDWADVTGRYSDFAKGPDASQANASFVPQAEAEVDARLAVKYTVPFSPAPYLVQDLCIDLAYYKATIRQKGSEQIKKYIDARFESILNGSMVLTNSDGVISGTGNYAWASNSYHSAFGMDDEVRWRVDDEQISDTEDLR